MSDTAAFFLVIVLLLVAAALGEVARAVLVLSRDGECARVVGVDAGGEPVDEAIAWQRRA